MSHRLRDNPDELDVLVTRIAAQTGVPAAHLEKDFWVTEVLKGASADSTGLLPESDPDSTTKGVKRTAAINSAALGGVFAGRADERFQERLAASMARYQRILKRLAE